MRKCVLEMKQAGGQWRQTEWVGFYFEHLIRTMSHNHQGITLPGEKIHRTTFDCYAGTNPDLKTHVIGSSTGIILNDALAMQQLFEDSQRLRLLVLTGSAIYDTNREDKRWHDTLKGAPSKYSLRDVSRSSRKRKSAFIGRRLSLYEISETSSLGVMLQGKNSNGKPRPTKYVLDPLFVQPLATLELNTGRDTRI